MTVNDIYRSALGITAQRVNDSDLECFAVGWINLLLAQSLEAENSVRRDSGQEPLEEAPALSALSDTVPCCPAITGLALPCGMAAFLFEAAGEAQRADDYRGRFLSALKEASRALPAPCADVY